jgi:hypothetical protein
MEVIKGWFYPGALIRCVSDGDPDKYLSTGGVIHPKLLKYLVI